MGGNSLLLSIQKFINALEEHNIIYCHWKSNEHLEEALAGDTDLDILFNPAQRTELEIVFNECGLKRFRATPLMQYNAIEDYIGFDQKEAKIWHVHTHYRLTLGEKHLKGYTISTWGEILLKDRVKSNFGVWIANPSEEFVLLLCRISLKLRWRDYAQSLNDEDVKEIAWLKEKITKNQINAAASNMLKKGSRTIILRLYSQEITDKSMFIPLQKALRKELMFFTAYSRFGSWINRTKREIFWVCGGIRRRIRLNQYSAYRRISPNGGLVVAILGCDGAGKSTTLSYIKKEFSKKIDVVSIYFGSGDGSCSLIRKPMKFIAHKVGGKGLGHEVDREYKEKKISFKSRIYSIAKLIWAVTLALEKKTKQRKMIEARNNGLLVLTDRYPQSIMPGASDGPLLNRYRNSSGILRKISEWEWKIYDSFSINAPDLTIKLVVPTKMAIERKPEMTEQEINRKKDIVMKMTLSENTVVIDTSQPFTVTRGEVMKKIWELI